MNEFIRDPARLFDVRGKIGIITGATGALGSVAAQVLAAAGVRLTLAGGNSERLSATVSACEQLGAEVLAMGRRPSTAADCEAIVAATTERFGGLDLLIVASGLNDVAPIVDMEPKRFEAVMSGNVFDAWLLCRAFGRYVIPQGRGGKVVLTSSTRGLLGHPAGYSAYCASKAATDGLARALGCEWGKHGITVNALAPTVFRSPLTEWMYGEDEKARVTRQAMLARVPLGRLGEPTDLAGPLLFLVSRASDFYTGHTLYADGGYTAG